MQDPQKCSTNKYFGRVGVCKGSEVITRVMVTERWLVFPGCFAMLLPLLKELLVHYFIEYAQHC